MRNVLLFGSLLFAVACGGGGGGGGYDSFAGAWYGDLFVTRNDCNLQLPGSFGNGVLYNVNQNGANVAVQNVTSGISLEGVADSKNEFFTAAKSLPFECAEGVPGNIRLSLTFLRENKNTAEVFLEQNVSCGLVENLCVFESVGLFGKN